MDKDWESLQSSKHRSAGVSYLSAEGHVRSISKDWIILFNHRYYQIMPKSRTADLYGQRVRIRCHKDKTISIFRIDDGTELLFELFNKKLTEKQPIATTDQKSFKKGYIDYTKKRKTPWRAFVDYQQKEQKE